MTKKLLQWKDSPNRKPLLLSGVRQVGKTYLLKEFGKTHFKNFYHINFEKEPEVCKIFDKTLDPIQLINKLSFFIGKQINVKEDLLIFDEVQACPRALTSLKYFCEEMPELALCAAGSLLGIHLKPGSFPVGKVNRLTLYPLSFEEFLTALDDKLLLELIDEIHNKIHIPEIAHQKLWDRLKLYFIIGGLPEVVATFCQNQDQLFQAIQNVKEKQKQLIADYHDDIAKHAGKVNTMHILRTWHSIPSQLEKTHDATAARFRFRGVVHGVERYQQLAGAIDWLEAAGLVIKISIAQKGQIPLSSHCKENLFKLLIFDVGILASMSGLSPKSILDYNYGSYKGYFAENFVAQEFLYSGCEKLYSWQEDRSEIEFIREFDGTLFPVEVKSGWITKAQSLQKFCEKYHPPYRTVLSAKPLAIKQERKTHYYPLYLASKFPIHK